MHLATVALLLKAIMLISNVHAQQTASVLPETSCRDAGSFVCQLDGPNRPAAICAAPAQWVYNILQQQWLCVTGINPSIFSFQMVVTPPNSGGNVVQAPPIVATPPSGTTATTAKPTPSTTGSQNVKVPVGTKEEPSSKSTSTPIIIACSSVAAVFVAVGAILFVRRKRQKHTQLNKDDDLNFWSSMQKPTVPVEAKQSAERKAHLSTMSVESSAYKSLWVTSMAPPLPTSDAEVSSAPNLPPARAKKTRGPARGYRRPSTAAVQDILEQYQSR